MKNIQLLKKLVTIKENKFVDKFKLSTNFIDKFYNFYY